ncbi:alpha/beta fold hydrolase [Microbacterium aoyamense]|uniref:Alpha/beta fold hydrolase n=1 Tax=Microbacterium aoyamense TaxID=344166 RepID=A0ABN2PG19_9MICO|nr:alpha/beta fold hydrolase [Microbacterium aoyamense]
MPGTLIHHETHGRTAITPFSHDPDFDFEIRSAIGHSTEGAAEIGEVLAATSGIRKGDHDAWFTAWHDLALRTLAIADDAAAHDHVVSASEAYLRASAYFGVAVNAASGGEDDALVASTFAQQQAAWDAFVDHAPVAVDRVEIPYEGRTLPGWLFLSSTPAPHRATIVAVNGSDGSLAAMWASCVAPALRRGYNVLVFDGPGQQSQLFDKGTTFRPDWENVLTPVFDAVSRMPGVDPDRIAVYGISQGGYWVARAIAFEHRFVAAITDPGIVDVSTSWTSQVPKSLLRALDAGDTAKFDQEMAFGMRFSPETARRWRFRARPYGTKGFAETVEAVRAYTVADVAHEIATPLLILSPEGEQFWPGQSARLASLTPDFSTVIDFTTTEGADGHCEPLARTRTAQRMLDWLDDRLSS